MRVLRDTFSGLTRCRFSCRICFATGRLLGRIVSSKRVCRLCVFSVRVPRVGNLRLTGRVQGVSTGTLFMFLAKCARCIVSIFRIVAFSCVSGPVAIRGLRSILLGTVRCLRVVGHSFIFRFQGGRFHVDYSSVICFRGGNHRTIVRAVSRGFGTGVAARRV